MTQSQYSNAACSALCIGFILFVSTDVCNLFHNYSSHWEGFDFWDTMCVWILCRCVCFMYVICFFVCLYMYVYLYEGSLFSVSSFLKQKNNYLVIYWCLFWDNTNQKHKHSSFILKSTICIDFGANLAAHLYFLLISLSIFHQWRHFLSLFTVNYGPVQSLSLQQNLFLGCMELKFKVKKNIPVLYKMLVFFPKNR